MTRAAGEIISNWTLGSTSVLYETGGKGVKAISSGNGDYGGASYGAYQLSSATGTLGLYLNSNKYGNYSQYFLGLTPGSVAFNAKWLFLAENDSNFALSQHDFIKDTHYITQLNSLISRGFDLSKRGAAVQDMLWSTSVQFGGSSLLVEKAIRSAYGSQANLGELSDVDIITAVQNYKIQNNEKLFEKSSEKVRRATLARAGQEKNSLLNLAKIEADAILDPYTPEVEISNENATGIAMVTTTLGGTTNAGMYTATEITNTETGQVDYIIRHNGTGEAVASGSSYAVNANDTITTTSGGSQFTHGLTDGRLLEMQSADGSGLVVGQNGNDFYFDAGSSVQLNTDGSVTVNSPVVAGVHTVSTYSSGELVQAQRIFILKSLQKSANSQFWKCAA